MSLILSSAILHTGGSVAEWLACWTQTGPGSNRSLVHPVVLDRYVHTHGPLSGTTRVSRYQKGKTNLVDFTEARDSEWQWHQLGHIQVCTSLQTDNHASAPTTQFLQAGCRSGRLKMRDMNLRHQNARVENA